MHSYRQKVANPKDHFLKVDSIKVNWDLFPNTVFRYEKSDYLKNPADTRLLPVRIKYCNTHLFNFSHLFTLSFPFVRPMLRGIISIFTNRCDTCQVPQ